MTSKHRTIKQNPQLKHFSGVQSMRQTLRPAVNGCVVPAIVPMDAKRTASLAHIRSPPFPRHPARLRPLCRKSRRLRHQIPLRRPEQGRELATPSAAEYRTGIISDGVSRRCISTSGTGWLQSRFWESRLKTRGIACTPLQPAARCKRSHCDPHGSRNKSAACPPSSTWHQRGVAVTGVVCRSQARA